MKFNKNALIFTVFWLLNGLILPAQGVEPGQALALESFSSSGLSWVPLTSYQTVIMTVSTPRGEVFRKQLETGDPLHFDLSELVGMADDDGSYTYQLTFVNGELLPPEDEMSGQPNAPEVRIQSGGFSVQAGRILNGSRVEAGYRQADQGGGAGESIAGDVVHADDEIVTGSLCIGYDCLTDGSESFGFDTIKLKENNIRIKFDDTSTTGGFPAVDWQLLANDSNSGGQNKFTIEDVTNSRVPFTVLAGAPSNSLFISAAGRIGLGTATPACGLDIVKTGEYAGLALEQTGGARALFTAAATKARIGTANNFPLNFVINNALAMTLTSNQYLGIGINPVHPLHMASGAYCSAGGVWTDASSITLKENVRSLTPVEAVQTLAELRPVRYNYKADKSDEHLGFIAEEVPELVATADRQGMSPMDVVALLTKVVQEQQESIRRLESRLDELEKQETDRSR